MKKLYLFLLKVQKICIYKNVANILSAFEVFVLHFFHLFSGHR